MSEDQLKAFIAKAQSDPKLQEQLKAEGADPIAIAKAAGFTIKQQDLFLQASELSDDELEGVAGGTGIVLTAGPTASVTAQQWTPMLIMKVD